MAEVRGKRPVPSLWDERRSRLLKQRPLPTPPPSQTRRAFGAHRSTSRKHVERMCSPRSRLLRPEQRGLGASLSSLRSVSSARADMRQAERTCGSFAAVYAHQGRWKRMATPCPASLSRYHRSPPRAPPQSAPQLSHGRGGLAGVGESRPDRAEGATPRPHTSGSPVDAAADTTEELADGPETWNWSGLPEYSREASMITKAASRGSISSPPRPLAEEGSWFDENAWSRIKADRNRRKAAQQEEQEEYWRVAVRPWLARKQESSRETYAQKRLRRAREEQLQLRQRLEDQKQATRHSAYTLLKDMRSLLTLNALQNMSPRQTKLLDRWVDDTMLHREFPPSLMQQVEHMHESLVRQLFESIDEDSSGCLDKDEVRILASKLGVRLTEAQSQEALIEMKTAQTTVHGLWREGDSPRAGASRKGHSKDELTVTFRQFYAWWLKNDKDTALKPPTKVHTTSYFTVMPI